MSKKGGEKMLTEQGHETGRTTATRQAGRHQPGQVTKIRVDSEVARAMGHDRFSWRNGRFEVKTEPLPQSVD